MIVYGTAIEKQEKRMNNLREFDLASLSLQGGTNGSNPSRCHRRPSLPLTSQALEAATGTTRMRVKEGGGAPPPSRRSDLGRLEVPVATDRARHR
jgi:hypothetical protein